MSLVIRCFFMSICFLNVGVVVVLSRCGALGPWGAGPLEVVVIFSTESGSLDTQCIFLSLFLFS